VPRQDAATQLSLTTTNELWVDKGADPSIAARGQYERPFATIQAALAVAIDGDVVRVRPGSYSATDTQIVIPTGVSLVGVDRRRCRLTYAGSASVAVVSIGVRGHLVNFDLVLNPTGGTTTGFQITDVSGNAANISVNPSSTGSIVGCEFTFSGQVGSGKTNLKLCELNGLGTGNPALRVNNDSLVAACRDSSFTGDVGIEVLAGSLQLFGCHLHGTTLGLKTAADSSVELDTANVVSGYDIQGVVTKHDLEFPRNNLDTTTDPALTDDVTKGYATGSRWLNVTTGTLYTCLNATEGAAFWSFVQTNDTPTGSLTPGEHFLGSLMDYGGAGGVTAGEVQYTKTFLTGGTIITAMRCYVDTGGSASRFVRMGVYSQADPTNPSSVPATRVAQTNSEATTGADGAFFTKALTASYTVPVTGYYWVAFITNNAAALKFSVSPGVYRTGFLPVRRESSTGTTLPATVGTITNPSSALVYCSAVE
jgi:hypothetical protein